MLEFIEKRYKNEDCLLFMVIYPKINKNVVNLPTQIRENANFPQQLPSAKANFEGCKSFKSFIPKYTKANFEGCKSFKSFIPKYR